MKYQYGKTSRYLAQRSRAGGIPRGRMSAEEVNLVDTHVHTRYSDGTASVRDVEEVCLHQQIGCCIADHNEIRGSLKLLERQKAPTVPAIEVGSSEQIEMMVFFRLAEDLEQFFKEHVEPFRRDKWYTFLPRSLDYLISAAREYESLVSVPHPFAPLWKNIEYGHKRREVVAQAIERADAIEVWNGNMTKRANRRAMRLCRQMAFIPLGGSDSHEIEGIGSVVVALANALTSESLFHALALGQISGIWGRNERPKYLANTWHVLRRHSQKFIAASGESFFLDRRH